MTIALMSSRLYSGPRPRGVALGPAILALPGIFKHCSYSHEQKLQQVSGFGKCPRTKQVTYHVVLKVFTVFQLHRVDFTGLVALADLEECEDVLHSVGSRT